MEGGLNVVWDDSNHIDMLNYWYKHFAIDLYVEHEIDSEPLVEQDINASHVYENDDLEVGEEVVLGAIEGSNKGGRGW